MDTYTKPPWFMVEHNSTDFTAIATKPRIGGRLNLDAEVLGSSEWMRVRPEDLRLMAAAPELLEALQGLLNAIDTETDLPIDDWDEVGAAKAAIAKAVGNDNEHRV